MVMLAAVPVCRLGDMAYAQNVTVSSYENIRCYGFVLVYIYLILNFT